MLILNLYRDGRSKAKKLLTNPSRVSHKKFSFTSLFINNFLRERFGLNAHRRFRPTFLRLHRALPASTSTLNQRLSFYSLVAQGSSRNMSGKYPFPLGAIFTRLFTHTAFARFLHDALLREMASSEALDPTLEPEDQRRPCLEGRAECTLMPWGSPAA